MIDFYSPLEAMRSVHALGRHNDEIVRAVDHLSSGSRIGQASDDAAALALGSRLRAEVGALKTLIGHVNQGQSVLQIADGAMRAVEDILVRLRALASQAGAHNLGDFERGLLDAEFQELLSELDRIAYDTRFEGRQLVASELVLRNLDEDFVEGQNGLVNLTARLFNNRPREKGGDGGFDVSMQYSADGASASRADFRNVRAVVGRNTDTMSGINAAYAATDSATNSNAAWANGARWVNGDWLQRTRDATFSSVITTSTAPVGTGLAQWGSREIVQTTRLTQGASPHSIDTWTDYRFDPPTSLAISIDVTAQGSPGNTMRFTGNSGPAQLARLSESGLFIVMKPTAIAGELSEQTQERAEFLITLSDDFNPNPAPPFYRRRNNGIDPLPGLRRQFRESFEIQEQESGPDYSLTIRAGTGTIRSEDQIDLAIEGVTLENLGITGLDISRKPRADLAWKGLEQALDFTLKARAKIGAAENRMAHASQVVMINKQNIEEGRSRYLDLDVAQRVTELTLSRIRQEQAVAVLAQAQNFRRSVLRQIFSPSLSLLETT